MCKSRITNLLTCLGSEDKIVYKHAALEQNSRSVFGKKTDLVDTKVKAVSFYLKKPVFYSASNTTNFHFPIFADPLRTINFIK
jgi:hypothetical protein